MKYKAIVLWNGNHYFSGEEVSGSKIETRSDGTLWLFDDEPDDTFPMNGNSRDEWVEIDPISLEEEIE